MATYIHTIQIINDSVVEPVSRTDIKDWLRVKYDTDDNLIDSLISSARGYIEKATGLALVNRTYEVMVQTISGQTSTFVVDLPYGPLLNIVEVYFKNGINSYDLLTNNDSYEVIGGKLWLYSSGVFKVKYNSGYSSIPDDLRNDIMTLVGWMYENRGKKMNADSVNKGISQYPFWNGLNYHNYKKIVI